jgi:peptide/nickel transport system permease protein
VLSLAAGAVSTGLLCVPSAALALALVFAGGGAGKPLIAGAIALVLFPRVFRYARGILRQAARSPHVLAARSRGVPRMRLVLINTLAPSLGSLLALLGVSVSMALGVAIPIEVVTGSAGLGQLAWQAAMQRDLPLLLDVALVVTAVAVGANSLADGAARVYHGEEAA